MKPTAEELARDLESLNELPDTEAAIAMITPLIQMAINEHDIVIARLPETALNVLLVDQDAPRDGNFFLTVGIDHAGAVAYAIRSFPVHIPEAQAAHYAAMLARNCVDYYAGRITNPVAVKALTRAIHRLHQSVLDPSVIELTEEEIRAFPERDDILKFGRHWLAVAVSADGHVAFCYHSIDPGDLDRFEGKLAAHDEMVRRLQPETDRVGFPSFAKHKP